MIKNPVNHILKNEGHTLAQLLNRVEVLQQIDGLFKQYLEPSLSKHCQVAKYDQQRLIVITDSGSWTTQLQYRVPDLLHKLREHPELKEIKAICCKTRPETSSRLQKKSPKRSIAPLSEKSALRILSQADNIQDEKLKKVLTKFAQKFLK